jgi:hypothetical protein
MAIFEIAMGFVLALLPLATISEIGVVGVTSVAFAVTAGLVLVAPIAAVSYTGVTVALIVLDRYRILRDHSANRNQGL